MPSTRKSTSVMMTSPHFLIQGQSCFLDEQPGHGEPSHEESAGDSASHTEIGRKGGWAYTVVSPWDLYVSCSGSSHFNFSLVLPILFLDTDFCGFTAECYSTVTVQCPCILMREQCTDIMFITGNDTIQILCVKQRASKELQTSGLHVQD